MRKKSRKLLPLICILLLSSFNCFSTHIVGGAITYRHLSGSDFEINMVLYRDCYNGIPTLLNPVYIQVYDNSGTLVQTIMMFRGNAIYIPNPDIYNYACHYKLPAICYEYGLYTATTTLPYSPGGYTLVYEICCLNWSITNHNSSGSFTASTYISDSTLLKGNSSPVFKQAVPAIICRGVPFQFDHSATDIDGDSLSYELFTPYWRSSPPFSGIPYLPGYSLASTTGSVDELKIDSLTGLLTVTVDSFGQYLYGVKVNEFRGGNYIGSVWRTYQLNAANCDTLKVLADFSTHQDSCTDEIEVKFKGSAKNVQNYYWGFGDGTLGYGPDPVHIFKNPGKYNIRLIGRSSVPGCADTLHKEILVDSLDAEDYVKADFNFIDKTCLKEISFQNMSINSADYYWNFGDQSAMDSLENPMHIYPGKGQYRIRLIAITGKNQCRDTLEKMLRISDKLKFDPFYTDKFCSNEISLNSNITGGDPNEYNLLWDLGNADTFSLTNLLYTYQDTGDFKIMLTSAHKEGYFGCNDTAYLEYHAKELIFPEFSISASQDTLYYNSDSITLKVDPENYSKYYWLPVGGVNNQYIPNPRLRPKKTTTYQVAVTNGLGCTSKDTVTIYVVPPRCGEADIFIPNSFTPNGDGENDYFRVRGRDIASIYLAIFNRWGEMVFESQDVNMIEDPSRGWNGNNRGKEPEPGVFVYMAKIICLGGAEYNKKGNVTLIR